MQKIIIIKSIANVIAGYTFRGAIKEDKESSLYVLQAKNISNEMVVNEALLVQTHCDTSHTKAFAQDGDVAIGARGAFRSAVVKSLKMIIVSASVYLLRVKRESNILPEFLSIYLNSPFGQKAISQIITGAAIKLILRKDLENIQIPLLPMSQQEKMVALYKNIKQQENLLRIKTKINKNIMNATLKELVRS